MNKINVEYTVIDISAIHIVDFNMLKLSWVRCCAHSRIMWLDRGVRLWLLGLGVSITFTADIDRFFIIVVIVIWCCVIVIWYCVIHRSLVAFGSWYFALINIRVFGFGLVKFSWYKGRWTIFRGALLSLWCVIIYVLIQRFCVHAIIVLTYRNFFMFFCIIIHTLSDCFRELSRLLLWTIT